MTFFIGLFVLGGLLVVIQSGVGGITGSGISEIPEGDDSLRLVDVKAFQEGDFVRVVFNVYSGEAKSVGVGYYLESDDGRIIATGEQEIVVESNRVSEGILRVYSPGGDGLFVSMSVGDDEEQSFKKVKIGSGRSLVTGSAIGIDSGYYSYFGLLLIGLFIVCYIAWYSVHNRRMGYLADSVNGRFIRLKDL